MSTSLRPRTHRAVPEGGAAARTAALLTAAVFTLSLAGAAQTRIELHSNRYTPEQDVQLGREAAAEVRQQLPMLNDPQVEDLVDDIGERLVNYIPEQFRQPAFRYSFDVVNLKEINAFALPGGPMFLNRGMIEAARTDGEVAGVMAHELSHVILRHGTAQATKGQKFQIGAIAGQVLGAIVGGAAGSVISQGSQFGLGAYFLKYGREFEREADLLGTQLMARSGYDPRQMAAMFQTIERQQSSRAPEWLSSHPNPGNRQEAIQREAAMLRVEGSANDTAEFQAVKSRLARMSPAPTSEQVARARESGQGIPGRVGTTGAVGRVEPPSGRWQTYQPNNYMRISVPGNWQQLSGGGTITYAPEGGYLQTNQGETAFTHGVQVGATRSETGNLGEDSQLLIQAFARSNPQLRQESRFRRDNIGGRSGLTTTLSNVSDVTGEREIITLSTVPLDGENLLFLIGVAPQSESRIYQQAFSRVRQSMQLAQ